MSTSITPAPSSSRGEIALQPNYFTSSLFVESLRQDIAILIDLYYQQFTQLQPTEPFSLFKSLWTSQGWQWMHLMVFDDRTRETFLNVVFRLFSERMIDNKASHCKAIALFGLYTFFYTQPRDTAPPLHSVNHIVLPLDYFISVKALPSSLEDDNLQPLRPHVSYMVSTFLKDKVFLIAPSSNLGPLNPRRLPREIFVNEVVVPLDPDPPKKKGRPTKREKARRARLALDNLERWLETTPQPLDMTGAPSTQSPLVPTFRQYQIEKNRILDSVETRPDSSMAVIKANQFVLARLRAVEDLFKNDATPEGRNGSEGVARVERAVEELGTPETTGRKGGALNLLEGAGKN